MVSMTTTANPQAPSATLLRAEVKRIDKSARSRWDLRPRNNRVRVFVTVTPDFPEPTGPLCHGSEKCGVYGPAACGEVDHKVWTNTYVRPGLAEQRRLLAEAIGREEFEALGALRFSVNAGCSMCPCSPGFIAEVTGTQDLFVTLEVARTGGRWPRDLVFRIDTRTENDKYGHHSFKTLEEAALADRRYEAIRTLRSVGLTMEFSSDLRSPDALDRLEELATVVKGWT